MHLLGYAYAIASILCLLMVIGAEWRHRPFRIRNRKRVVVAIPAKPTKSDAAAVAARQNLRQAYRLTESFRLDHHSLGKRQLDSDSETN